MVFRDTFRFILTLGYNIKGIQGSMGNYPNHPFPIRFHETNSSSMLERCIKFPSSDDQKKNRQKMPRLRVHTISMNWYET